MPNNETPSKRKPVIDQLAKEAITKLDGVIQAHKELELELKPVKDSLNKIAMDPHKPR
jgi:hypothetical protein